MLGEAGGSRFPRYRPLGDQAVLVQLGAGLSLEINARVRHLARRVRGQRIPGVQILIPTQNSLAIRYDPVSISYDELVERLRALEETWEGQPPATEALAEGKTVYVPVLYGGEAGPDLAEVARRVGLSEEEVVRRHCSRSYVVYMVGFHAGYPYMGDNDAFLQLPRRSTPRLHVPAGSVGIAMNQTIIYTVDSPGGWHLIGRTPMATFNPWETPPSLLVAGDTVRFVPIDAGEMEAWDQEKQRDWDRRWNPWRLSNRAY